MIKLKDLLFEQDLKLWRIESHNNRDMGPVALVRASSREEAFKIADLPRVKGGYGAWAIDDAEAKKLIRQSTGKSTLKIHL